MAVSAAAQKAYYARMLPYAKKVEAALGIPAEQEVAFWSWESDFGTNNASKHNNQAGITSGSSGKDYVAGGYAGYNSMDSFVKDRIRLLSKNFAGYPAIIAAAKSGQGYDAITKAHNDSLWSEDPYNVKTINDRARAVLGLPKPKPPAICPACLRPL